MKTLLDCQCYNCLVKSKKEQFGMPVTLSQMVVCEFCGNKRCPHGTDHNYKCTNSNKSGQKGSRYQ